MRGFLATNAMLNPEALICRLDRIGDLPKNPSDLQSLLGDLKLDPKDPYVRALILLTQAHTVGPQQLDQTSKRARLAADINRSRNNLKQIAIAFHNFHDAYQKFPSSVNTKEGARTSNKKPVQPFSWRVAILPFIEQNELFEELPFR